MSSLLNRGVTGGPVQGSPSRLVSPPLHESPTEHASVPMLAAANGGTNNPDKPAPLGNTRLICGGRCVWAQDGSSSIAVTVILLIFAGMFTYLFILDEEYRWACYLQYLFAFFVLVSMFEAVFTDPGIIEKQNERPSQRPPGGQIEYLELNGVKVFMPYCPTCNVIRPPRASHCHTCNNCVEKFDHHCGVIGACVGRGNFKFFFLFLISVVLYAWSTVGWSIFFLMKKWDSTDDVRRAFAIVNCVVGVIVGLQIGAMMVHYIRLTAKGRTQRENVKKDRIYEPPGSNPYDDGCVVNYYETCCM